MNVRITASEVWQQRLGRFAAAGLSVREFCDREGVSQASFYKWRRRLPEAARPASPQGKPAFQPVRLTTAAGLAIELPGGARLEVAADQVELARAVVREVAQAAQGGGV